MSNNYSLNDVIERIMDETGYPKSKICDLIEEKIHEYDQLITELAAALIIAKDFNINMSSQISNIPQSVEFSKLTPDLSNVTVIGRILRLYNVRSFKRKDGQEGVLQTILISDSVENLRILVWGPKVTDLGNYNCKVGDVLRIINGYTRLGRDNKIELHVGSNSLLQVNPEGILEKDVPKIHTSVKSVSSIEETDTDISIKVKTSSIDSNILEFQRSDGTKGHKKSIIVGDETGEISVNFWNDTIDEIKNLNVSDIIEIIGLNAKKNFDVLELHSTNFTTVRFLKNHDDINVKKSDSVLRKTPKEGKKILIQDIQENGKVVQVEGLIQTIQDSREFTRSDNTKGKVRSIIISDSSDSTIRVVLWDNAADRLTLNDSHKVIKILNGFTKESKYGNFEIHCNNQTDIQILENVNIEDFNVSFIDFDKVSENDEEINARGFVTYIEPVKTIKTKKGDSLDLQTFKLKNNEIEAKVICWREHIQKIKEITYGDYIELIDVRVNADKTYGLELTITGKTIIKKGNSSSMLDVTFVTGNNVVEDKNSKIKVTDIADLKEGCDAFICGTIVDLNERNMLFHICPTCRKKLNEESGFYHCTEHGNIDKYDSLLLFSFIVNDGTGSVNVVCTNKVAESILNLTVDEINAMIEEQSSDLAPFMSLHQKNFLNYDFYITGFVAKKRNDFLNLLEIHAKKVEPTNDKTTYELLKTTNW